MTAEDLLAKTRDLGVAADIVEAIDDREIQRRRGWDLTGWRYELVPWGVRFVYPGKGARCPSWWCWPGPGPLPGPIDWPAARHGAC